MKLTISDILEKYDTFLIDLWGVVWDGETVFEKSVGFCKRLHREGKRILFLSNCAEYVAETLITRLHKAGLSEASTDWLATSGQAMESWFRQNGLAGKPVYTFGGTELVENVRRAGAKPIDIPENGLSLEDHAESDVLVVGGVLNFDWQRLSEVITAIRAGKLRVVLPNPDYIIITANGRVKLPPGMIVHIFERALPGLQVDRIGKPYRFIYDYALEKAKADDRSRTLMIGDSLETDIRGAHNAGIPSMMVHHGVHAGEDLESIRKISDGHGVHPDIFAPELTEDTEFIFLDWKE
ncbi:MAG: TIGR01459 family HAD-type hydrolase [Candidatus Sumerlaeia bacterium]